ncbi:nucleotidyl transferase AbiEii/AbiGii toxin family protein [Fodinibius saliphilus]|uniref:nucleotidyl transferase AbiEii/AbiGii toxin family protein n=1 Tax=Fodinibius saliphilus TaxID=1920650 RepID=UPI001109F929|nr:nucleotidyl transferase AbiEii/AbiGii toxin family protein [Fodinibius saliphilus]
MDKPSQGTIDSIHQRLLNKARETNRPFNELLQYYAMEKFLLRMSKLANADDYVLKGALLLRATGISDIRPTRDIDVLKYGNSTIPDLEENIVECCKINVEEDGLVFDPESVEGEEIREQEAYDGVRIKVRGNLGNARITIQIDIGFGDVITPEPLWVEYPTMLDNNKPKIQAYTLESAIAEKYQAMVSFDLANSRMKDFYDIYFLSENHSFEGNELQKAIKETFERRETDIPIRIPTALSGDFFEDEAKVKQWNAFLSKISDNQVPKDHLKVADRLKVFLWPVSEALANSEHFDKYWEAGADWN